MEENKVASQVDFVKLLEAMAKPIVEHPDEVKITENVLDDSIVLTLSVADSDMGMIIGKHGKIAKAMRTVIKSASKDFDKKVLVEIR